MRNRRERQLTQFALPYDYTCFADGTPFYIELFGFFSRAPQEKYVLAKLVKENCAGVTLDMDRALYLVLVSHRYFRAAAIAL